MVFPSASARSAPRLVEPSTTRRSTAAADPILAGVTPSVLLCEGVTGAPIQRQPPANGFTAISITRTSSWRFSDPLRSGASSMARPAATAVSTGNGVAASTPTSIPFVLALSGLRALRIDVGAPPTAQEQSSAAPLVRRGQETVIGTFARGLTGRSTSSPGAGRYLVRSGRAKDPQDIGVPNREAHRSARPGKAPRWAEVRT